MCINFNGYHSGGSSFLIVNDCWLLQNYLYTTDISSVLKKKMKKNDESQHMVSHPETGSDSPIGSDRDRGRDKLTDLREEILREFHYSRFVVHLGGTNMYQDLRRQYYWSGMKRHVGDFIRRCLTCQQVKAENQKPARLIQPLEMAE